MKKIPEKFSGHIPDIQKIWTNSGQINWTNSGHEKFQKFFLDKFRTWTNSRQFPDKLQCPEMLIFWTTFRTMEMSGICTVSFLDKFRTNSGHSFFIGNKH